MSTVYLSPLAGAGWQFFDNNGTPLAGGLIYTYSAGTTTPQATYTTISGNIACANPIVLDSSGRTSTEIWLTIGQSYKFVLQNSSNVPIGTYDNISGINDSTNVFANLSNTTDVTQGDALVGFRQSNSSGALTGAVGRTVHQKLQEFVSVKDFGAVGDATFNSTTNIWSGTDNTSAFQAAFNTGLALYIPQGNYYVSSTLTSSNALSIRGDGSDFSVIVSASSSWTIRGNFTIDFEGFAIEGHTAIQANSTASGWDSFNAASHNWRLKDIRFQYLREAIWFSQSWIGEARDIYINDCGTSTGDWALLISNATNEVTFDNLQIRGGMGGIGPGTNGLWQGKGVYVTAGVFPNGNAGTACYDVNFINLGLEHLADEAAKFDDVVTIRGGYWENTLYPVAVNQVTFNNQATIIGGFLNCAVQTNNGSNPDFYNSWFAGGGMANGNKISPITYNRGTIDLTTWGSKIPFNQSGSPYLARLGSVSNFQNQSSVPGTINDYNGGSHTLAIASDGYFNTKSLTFTVTGTTDFGGAIGLPFALKPTSRTDVYGWAIMKCSSTDQMVLSLGGADSAVPGNTLFFSGTPGHWYYVMLGPMNPYDANLWVRLYGPNGGSGTVGSVLTLDSWGVSFGGIDLTGIYS